MLSSDLRVALAKDRVDMRVAVVPEGDVPSFAETTSVQSLWAAKEDAQVDPRAPIPIVRHPYPCDYATRLRTALRTSGRGWRKSWCCGRPMACNRRFLQGWGLRRWGLRR